MDKDVHSTEIIPETCWEQTSASGDKIQVDTEILAYVEKVFMGKL